MPRIEAEIRSRDLEQMIAEPTITEEPAPIGIGITITRLLSQTDRLTLSDEFNYLLINSSPAFYVVPRNLLENSNFEDTIDIMSGSGVSVDWAHSINSAHTLDIQSSREQVLHQLGLITSAKFDLTNSTGSGISELTQRSGITATGEVNVISGEVTSIDITYGGFEYEFAPTVTIMDTSGSGSGAIATAILTNGEVTDVTIIDRGSGYDTSTTTVTFSTPIRTASFEAWVYVESITGSPELRLLVRSLDLNTVLNTSNIETQDSVTTTIIATGGWNLLKVDGYDIPSSGQAITVSWSVPSDDGGSPIIGYHIRYRIGSNNWTEITTGISGTSHEITGLASTTTYEIQVRAVNAINFGEWSGSTTITTS